MLNKHKIFSKMQNRLKILLIGPPQAGKTTLANFLSESGEVASGDYRPTKGARIVEFEVEDIDANGLKLSVEVELWDTSGDKKFSNCWPAIQANASGVVFVYNPENGDHPRQIEALYSQFVSQQGLKDAQCLVLRHHKLESSHSGASLSSVFKNVTKQDSILDEDSGRVRQHFKEYLSQLMSFLADVNDRNEKAILR